MKKWRVEHSAWLALMLSFGVASTLALSVRDTFTVRLHAQSQETLLGKAHALQAQGQAADAEPVFALLIERYPDSEQVHVEWGRFLEEQGRLDEAERAYRRAVSLGRQQFSAVRRYAGFLDRAGKPGAALTLYETYVGEYPDDLPAQMDLGLRYLRDKRWAAAAESLKLAAARSDLEFPCRTNLATAYANMGKVRDAIDEWERVVAMGPEREKQVYLQDIAAAEESEGRLEVSLDMWRRYAEHFPSSILGVRRIQELCEKVESEDVCARAALRARAVSPPRVINQPLTNRIRVAGVSALVGELVPGGVLTGDVYFDVVATVMPETGPSAQFLIAPAVRADFAEAIDIAGEPSRVGAPPLWRGDTVRQAFSFELPGDLAPGEYKVGLDATPGGVKVVVLWTILISDGTHSPQPGQAGGEGP
ncbi:MAG: tetratricopeptide repeat protein [Candidatus Hydrogenedentes bacterium]|nr:tetratricopeptide repeat protein [Candidatus Hydrogenedentota bacterium]